MEVSLCVADRERGKVVVIPVEDPQIMAKEVRCADGGLVLSLQTGLDAFLAPAAIASGALSFFALFSDPGSSPAVLARGRPSPDRAARLMDTLCAGPPWPSRPVTMPGCCVVPLRQALSGSAARLYCLATSDEMRVLLRAQAQRVMRGPKPGVRGIKSCAVSAAEQLAKEGILVAGEKEALEAGRWVEVDCVLAPWQPEADGKVSLVLASCPWLLPLRSPELMHFLTNVASGFEPLHGEMWGVHGVPGDEENAPLQLLTMLQRSVALQPWRARGRERRVVEILQGLWSGVGGALAQQE